MHKVGVISDTHDLLRPEVTEKLQGCEVILHGGDISSQKILDALELVAPVMVVRGNNDKEWAAHLPETLKTEVFGLKVFMVHNKKYIPGDLKDTDLVIYGHSHKYAYEEKNGIFYLNPGSCGRRRFNQEITMALLEIGDDGKFSVEKILIPHQERGITLKEKEVPADLALILPAIMQEISSGKTVKQIARKHKISEELAEQICRMYLTHPGVDVDGIMRRLGL